MCGRVYWFQFSQICRHSAKNKKKSSKLKLQHISNNTTIFRPATCTCEVSSPLHRQTVTSLCNVWCARITASCCTLNFKQKSSAAAILHHRGLHSTLTAYDRKTNQGWKSSRCEHQGPAMALSSLYPPLIHICQYVGVGGWRQCSAGSVWQNWSMRRHWCNVKCNIKIIPCWPGQMAGCPLWL